MHCGKSYNFVHIIYLFACKFIFILFFFSLSLSLSAAKLRSHFLKATFSCSQKTLLSLEIRLGEHFLVLYLVQSVKLSRGKLWDIGASMSLGHLASVEAGEEKQSGQASD